jgi:hypothetical protein
MHYNTGTLIVIWINPTTLRRPVMTAGAILQGIYAANMEANYAAKATQGGNFLPASYAASGDSVSGSMSTDLSQSAFLSKIAQKYDVRNISPREMAAMSLELYQSGAISFQDHALLSFQPELGPQFNDIFPEAYDKADTSRDYIAQWESQLKIHEKYGDATSAKNDRRIINILANLSTLHDSADVSAPQALV